MTEPEERRRGDGGAAATTVWITADQCLPKHPALATADPATTTILMIESIGWWRERRHHQRKLVLIFAAMRGYADDLRAAGWTVDYYAEQDAYEAPLAEHIARCRPARFVMMAQSEYGVDERLSALVAEHGVPMEIVPHANFISTAAEFEALFTPTRARVTMETFYRRMRLKTGLLMDGKQPAGGTWNLDRENRRPPKRGMTLPPEPLPPERPHIHAAIALVERHFADHPGSIGEFDIPTTRADALAYADDFFTNRLAGFGAYEDAMLRGERRMYHSRLSAPINLGLLHPLELCERAELAYRSGAAPLASVEGFIRQIIGWREFIWQTYWRVMPEYRTRNALSATLPVPAFYRDGNTSMACVGAALEATFELGWAHHIQRLMILGNFALLAGCEPQAMTDWFWEMYVDGYDWVMVPNVIGMTLHADGGLVGTKAYAASANYINRMSDYCKSCAYDPKQTLGDDACPYNALYWDFLARHEAAFAANPRMLPSLRAWRAKETAWQRAVRTRAAALRNRLREGGRM
jgi:deoxyribodipyrimidine photolyase-related protein